MLNASYVPAFFTGVALTTLLVSAGLGIGHYVGRRRQQQDSLRDMDHIRQMAGGLAKWTSGFASDVTAYNQLVDEVTGWIRQQEAGDPDSDMATAVQLLSQVAQANELLKVRLQTAETTLQSQAEEIQDYMSEALTDALTGLPNRRAFDDELARRVAEWRRHRKPLSVAMVDVDHFKRFNDQYGHVAGDHVLMLVAQLLQETLRDSDLVARYGGEEFAIVLPCGDINEARQVAERIRKAVARAKLEVEGQELQVTISCGAAQVLDRETGSYLVQRADEALYAAKRSGRDSAWWHDGAVCHPVSPGQRQTPAVPAGRDEANNVLGDEFRQACQELRNRLQTIGSPV